MITISREQHEMKFARFVKVVKVGLQVMLR